jgi:flagellar hook-associated protein 2
MSAVSSSSGAVQLSGLASGINWTNIISELLTVARAPETQMTAQQDTDNNINSAYQTIGSDLTTLGNDVTTLSNPSFFQSRTASVSDPSVASATAAQGTPLGSFTFNVSQLATDASQLGTPVTANPLNSTDNVSNLVIGTAGFATPVTAGTFTVNGQAITISTSDTLQSIFTQISTATNGAVTGSYNATTDEMTLNSSKPIVLGSATDTSNFLQSAELYNNGMGIITSTSALGGINLNSTLNSANLATAITDGGGGNGEFLINGVQINFDASTSTINEVLQEINNSSAGVTATFDGANNSFELTNNTPGDVGISLQDVNGNFLAATGLSTGNLQAGSNLKYNINGGGTEISESNTVDAGSAGLAGLSITAQGVGSSTIMVGSDTSTVATAVQSFVTDYNAVQTYISSQTSPTTGSSGTVTPGLLTGDLIAEGIEDTLRQLVGVSPDGSSGAVQSLNDLGIQSNGADNLLTVPDASTMTNAIANNLSDVQNLFTNATNGVATGLTSYLTSANGPGGLIDTAETNMSTDSENLTKSINALNERLSAEQTELTNEFTQMETAINTINTQKEYLNAYFSAGSTASSNAAPDAQSISYGGSDSSSSSGA